MAWSEKAKLRNRRKRKARRLFKKSPLFAYSAMLEVDPTYTYKQFTADLACKKPPKRRKGKEKYSEKLKDAESLYRQIKAEDRPPNWPEIKQILSAVKNPHKYSVFAKNKYFVYEGYLPGRLSRVRVQNVLNQIMKLSSYEEAQKIIRSEWL